MKHVVTKPVGVKIMHHKMQVDLGPSRPGRWDEKYHVAIGTGLTIIVIFGIVFGIGYGVPKGPPPTAEQYANLGLDSATRMANRRRAELVRASYQERTR